MMLAAEPLDFRQLSTHQHTKVQAILDEYGRQEQHLISQGRQLAGRVVHLQEQLAALQQELHWLAWAKTPTITGPGPAAAGSLPAHPHGSLLPGPEQVLRALEIPGFDPNLDPLAPLQLSKDLRTDPPMQQHALDDGRKHTGSVVVHGMPAELELARIDCAAQHSRTGAGPLAEAVEAGGSQHQGVGASPSSAAPKDEESWTETAVRYMHKSFNDIDKAFGSTARDEIPQTWWQWAYFWLFSFIHPSSVVRVYWDIFIFWILAWVCISAPYNAAFGIKMENDTPLGVLQIFIDSVFMFDVLLNMRTAYNNHADGKLVTRPGMILKQYLRTWFLIDVVSALPLELFVEHEASGLTQLTKAPRLLRLIKVLRLLKLAKLVRLLQVSKVVGLLEDQFGISRIRLIGFTTGALMVLHFTACGFYYMAYFWGLSHNFHDTWIETYQLQAVNNTLRYIASMYFAVSTMATVGYGDIGPVNTRERVYTIICMALGVTIFAYLMGSVTAMLNIQSASEARTAARRQDVDDFCRWHKLPHALVMKIKGFFMYVLEKKVHQDDQNLLSELSGSLQQAVVLHIFKDTLERVPFFCNKHPQFITQIVSYLDLELYSAGDYVVRQDDVGTNMYFISEGRLEVRVFTDILSQPQSRNKLYTQQQWHENVAARRGFKRAKSHRADRPFKVVGTLQTGQYFGEVACLTGQLRTASVVAQTMCEVYSLTRSNLLKVVRDWPNLESEFETFKRGVRAK